MNWQERVLTFGPSNALAGVLTRPAGVTPARGPAVLLLNAGLLHHVGPARLHVRLARALAREGFSTLRFDLSGLGDSSPRSSSLGADNDAVADTLAAVEALRAATGAATCVAGGLCSGSDNAFKAALSTEAIAGLIQLDPWVHPTGQSILRRFGPSLLRPSTWMGVLGGRINVRRALASLSVGTDAEGEADAIDPMTRPFPEREWLESAYGRLLARQVDFCCLFSGTHWHYYNYVGQLRASYARVPFGPALVEHRFPDADHLFSRRVDQDAAITLVVDWLTSRAWLAER